MKYFLTVTAVKKALYLDAGYVVVLRRLRVGVFSA